MNITKEWPYLVVIAFLGFMMGRAEAQIYKWVDDKGVVTYSNVDVPKGAEPLKGEVNVVKSDPVELLLAQRGVSRIEPLVGPAVVMIPYEPSRNLRAPRRNYYDDHPINYYF